MNSQNNLMDTLARLVIAVGVGVLATVSTLGSLSSPKVDLPEEVAVARVSQAECYIEGGAAKVIAASGCEYEFQSGSTLDVQAGATVGLADVTFSDAITINSTLNVTGAVDLDSTLNVDGNTTLNGTLDVDGNLTSGTGAVTVADTLQVTGLADFDSGLTYGSTPLYPLGNTADLEVVCGTTGTFTGSTTVNVTDLTTATYVLASQVTVPTTTAAFLSVSDPSTTTVTLTSKTSALNTATTGITAHYCVVGNP